MFLVNFPEILVFTGLVYLLNGMYGVSRGLKGSSDNYFQWTMYFQWCCTLFLMIGVQTWYST